MGLRHLTGTPWHIERYTREEGDGRRHRSRCRYYSDYSFCVWFSERCHGSAHCSMYYEDKNKSNVSHIKRANGKARESEQKCGNNKTSIAENSKNTQRIRNLEKIFAKGSRVVHKTFGAGTIVECKDGRVTVLFENEKKIKLSLETCIDNNLLFKEKNN